MTFNVLPSYGRGDTIRIGWWTSGLFTLSGLKALILPSITLGTFQLALILRLVRAEIMEVMRTDFIKFARARGLPLRVIYFKHALMAALIPVVTVVGLQIGSLIAFAIVTETVFQWPGMGFLFIQAVNFGDVPVIAAYLVLTAFIFVVINLIVDLLYVVIDPRLSSVRLRERTMRAISQGRGWWARALDSDLAFNFFSSPGAMVATFTTALLILAAATASWISPHHPLDLASLDLLDAELPPAWVPGGTWRFVLGTDNQGRDVLSAILYGLRTSLLVGFASIAFAMIVGVSLGLASGLLRGWAELADHAHRRHSTQLSGNPDRASDQRRRANRHAAIALGRARARRADPLDRFGQLGAVRAHHPCADYGRERKGIRTGGAHDRPEADIHRGPPHPAEHAWAGNGCRDY